jgi:hypothetical protein
MKKLGEAGIGPNDIMVFFGRPIPRADHAVAAGSHHLLPLPDRRPRHPCGMASKKPEMYRRDGFKARSNGSVNCS